MNTAEAQFLAQ